MARIRTIKPEFFRHERLYDAEREHGLPLRLAFAGLWTAADREGRFRWSPRALKLDCLPYDDVDFERVLDALASRGFVVKYAVDGKEYGLIPGWSTHQVVNNKEKPSDIPAPKDINELTRGPRVDDASATPLCNFQGEGKGKGKDSEADASAADAAPEAYPIDPVERLWSEGLDLLKASGLTEKTVRPNIGRWLSTSRNDAGRVLDAIRRARDMGSKDPIPLVTRILNPSLSGGANAGKTRTVHDAAIALEQWAREDEHEQRSMLQIGSG